MEQMEKAAPLRKTKQWVWNLVELQEWIFEETKKDFGSVHDQGKLNKDQWYLIITRSLVSNVGGHRDGISLFIWGGKENEHWI